MNRMTKSNVALLEQLIENVKKEYDACGIAVAVIDKKGETKYQKFFGYRDEEKKLPIDENTIFGLASVTKSFTSLAIMQMAEKGIINLYDPISKYIPEFTNKNQDTVRIWHLMCHSGGFFPLPRIVVEDVAKALNLDEEVEGIWHTAISWLRRESDWWQNVWMNRQWKTDSMAAQANI